MGGGGGEHPVVCLFLKQQIGKGRGGREGVSADLKSLNRHFRRMCNPVPEMTLTPRCSWL